MYAIYVYLYVIFNISKCIFKSLILSSLRQFGLRAMIRIFLIKLKKIEKKILNKLLQKD